MIYTISQALNDSPEFSHLNKKLAELLSLSQDLSSSLPNYLRPKVQVANVDDDILIVLVENNGLAARLRQHMPDIVTALQIHGWAINYLKIKVVPQSVCAQPPQKQARFTQTAIDCLSQLAQNLQDCELQDALQNLLKQHNSSISITK